MEALFLRPKPIEFGSKEALHRFLDSIEVLNESGTLPLDIDHADWVGVHTPSESFSEAEPDFDMSIIDARSRPYLPHRCFCCLSCTEVMGASKPQPQSDLLTQWARIQYRDQPQSVLQPLAELIVERKESGTELSETGLNTPEPLLLDPPNNQSPSSTCNECGASLLSAKAFMSPPGFCEYSGKLICGLCFEPRQVVIPWKLIRGSKTFRGSMTRAAARLVQTDLYNPVVSLEEIQERIIESPQGCYIIRRCDELRKRIIAAKTAGVSCVGSQIYTVLAHMPGHIRTEKSRHESELYSLADLIDLLSSGKESVILTALVKAATVIDTHACEMCQRVCLICDREISVLDPKFFACGNCNNSFHSKCFSWSSDGCPACVSNRVSRIQSDSDDSLVSS